MNCTILCVGKLKERYWSEACSEYLKRLSAYCKPQVIEIPEVRLPDSPSPAQIEMALLQEGAALLQRLPAGSLLISLCVEGEPFSSEALSQTLARYAVNGAGSFSFAIGGSFGLSKEVKHRSALRLSMSSMTFPHTLARVMLLEQLYRAFSIQAHTKYHK